MALLGMLLMWWKLRDMAVGRVDVA
jgi:hypothetical protein